jgi:hypothetical protein
MSEERLALDEELGRLVEQAARLGGHSSIDEAAAEALNEYLQTAYARLTDCLNSHARVAESCIYWDDGRIKAIVRLKGSGLTANAAAGDSSLQRELADHCRSHLPEFAPPEVFTFTDDSIDCDAIRKGHGEQRRPDWRA